MARQETQDIEQIYVSPAELATRWRMSRTGAIRIAEKAGIKSIYLGGIPRSTRRFRLREVIEYEDSVTE